MSRDYVIQMTDSAGKVSFYHKSGAWRDCVYHGTWYKAVTANKMVVAFQCVPRAKIEKIPAPTS